MNSMLIESPLSGEPAHHRWCVDCLEMVAKGAYKGPKTTRRRFVCWSDALAAGWAQVDLGKWVCPWHSRVRGWDV